MRKIIAVVVVLVSTISFSTIPAASDQIHQKHSGIATECMIKFPHSDMFTGITFTEYQRQRIRDLMALARHQFTPMYSNDLDTLYKLTTAKLFDEKTYRRGLESFAQNVIKQQIIYARIYHQMYRMLTPKQRAICDKNHQARMMKIREISEMQPVIILDENRQYQ